MLKNKKSLIVVLAVFLILSAAAGVWFWMHKPADVQEMGILLSEKAEYEIISGKRFKFWKEGYEEVFEMEKTKPGVYTLGIDAKGECLLSDWESKKGYEYEGVLRVDFIHRGRVLLSEKVKKNIMKHPKRKNVKYYGKIELYRFTMPLLGKFDRNLKVSVKVIEPDHKLKVYEDCVKIFIGRYEADEYKQR